MINSGKYDLLNDCYVKFVNFSKAVLWKDRQLSLPLPIMKRIEEYNLNKIVFIDKGKKEKWEFKTEKVKASGQVRTVGQEPQWYFPIELAVKSTV